MTQPFTRPLLSEESFFESLATLPRIAQRIIDTYIARSGTLAAAGIELLEAHRAKKAQEKK